MDKHSLDEQARIIMDFATVLFVNGQTTAQVLHEARKLAKALNLTILCAARWGELWLQISDSNGERSECLRVVDPVGVHMGRVIATMNTLDAFHQSQITLEQAYQQLLAISTLPPYPAWLFSLAAAFGALALAVIFGVQQWPAAASIVLSAGLGGFARRSIAKITDNILIQPFVAALIAGVIGALAVQGHLSSSLRLVALCPCMVLVPGPHFLNSSLDFIHGRIPLGIARLTFAGLISACIALGVLLGMVLLGVDLPVAPRTSYIVPFWQDMIAAGVAIGAYSIFFSTPLRLIGWPLVVGVLAHLLRWLALNYFDTSIAFASFLACLFVGMVLTLAAYYKKMPFASLGFAAVVSMIPGVFIFRMASGIISLTDGSQVSVTLLSQTLFDALNALVITLAISIGLLGPKVFLDKMKAVWGR